MDPLVGFEAPLQLPPSRVAEFYLPKAPEIEDPTPDFLEELLSVHGEGGERFRSMVDEALEEIQAAVVRDVCKWAKALSLDLLRGVTGVEDPSLAIQNAQNNYGPWLLF